VRGRLTPPASRRRSRGQQGQGKDTQVEATGAVPCRANADLSLRRFRPERERPDARLAGKGEDRPCGHRGTSGGSIVTNHQTARANHCAGIHTDPSRLASRRNQRNFATRVCRIVSPRGDRASDRNANSASHAAVKPEHQRLGTCRTPSKMAGTENVIEARSPRIPEAQPSYRLSGCTTPESQHEPTRHVMSRPFARHPPIRISYPAHIGGVRLPASLRHFFARVERYEYTESRCRVCMSPHRWFIENLTLAGAPYNFIARQTPPDWHGRNVDRRSVSLHHRKHMRRSINENPSGGVGGVE
jgi:hypothetical protein